MSSKASAVVVRNLGLVAIGQLACSCDPGGPSEPEPAIAFVSVTPAEGAPPAHPLRLAVVWPISDGLEPAWSTTYDAPVRSGQRYQLAMLSLPEPSVRARLKPFATAEVDCGPEKGQIAAPVLLPRILIYEDVDGSGNFNPAPQLAVAGDRVWGISETERFPVLAFSDLEGVLSALPLEAAECLRASTVDVYSAFFQGRYIEGRLSSSAARISVYIHLSASDYAQAAFACTLSQNAVRFVGPVGFESRQRWLDATIPGDLCAEDPTRCERADPSALVLPTLTSYADPGYQRTAECYVFGSLDVLQLRESRLECEGCRCRWRGISSSWVVDPTRVPAGWPCGPVIEYCSTPATSLWSEPSLCLVQPTRPSAD